MPDQDAANPPVGAVDASGEPMPIAEVTPPELPPMVDEDGRGEINGEVDDDLEVQGGE